MHETTSLGSRPAIAGAKDGFGGSGARWYSRWFFCPNRSPCNRLYMADDEAQMMIFVLDIKAFTPYNVPDLAHSLAWRHAQC